MLEGIIPVVFIPFDAQGEIDEPGLRRVVRFELDGGVDGIGVNGFASEAYKLTDDERRRAQLKSSPARSAAAPRSSSALRQAAPRQRYARHASLRAGSRRR